MQYVKPQIYKNSFKKSYKIVLKFTFQKKKKIELRHYNILLRKKKKTLA